MGNNENKSFWSSIPGILTAIAAVITACAGLIAVLVTLPRPNPFFPATETSMAPATQMANPTDTPVSSPLKPVLTLKGTEEYEANGKTWIRYRLNIENWQDFPSEFFEPSPNLPPCGLNENSARAWVNIYDGENDSYIYGFCAFSEPKDLQLPWFAVEKGLTPPSTVYVVINDRLEEKLYISNKIAIR